MKALFVNGSPRKNWNTHKMFDSAIDRKIYSGLIYTMNCPEDLAAKIHYPEYLEPNANAMNKAKAHE